MSEFKGTKTASDYIETVYGTKTFARALDCNDAMSIMDLMQDFSDYNLKNSKASEMLEMLKIAENRITKLLNALDRNPNDYKENLQDIQQLIKSATEV